MTTKDTKEKVNRYVPRYNSIYFDFIERQNFLKFINSEKATNFCEISILTGTI